MSGSAARRKGNAAEVEVVHALRRAGWEAETSRNARNGTQRGEDIVTDFPMSIEVKNHTRTDLAGWWAQAQEQSGGAMPVVIHKRVGKTKAEDWWVTMDFQTLLDLVKVLQWEESAQDVIDDIASKVRKELFEARKEGWDEWDDDYQQYLHEKEEALRDDVDR